MLRGLGSFPGWDTLKGRGTAQDRLEFSFQKRPRTCPLTSHFTHAHPTPTPPCVMQVFNAAVSRKLGAHSLDGKRSPDATVCRSSALVKKKESKLSL